MCIQLHSVRKYDDVEMFIFLSYYLDIPRPGLRVAYSSLLRKWLLHITLHTRTVIGLQFFFFTYRASYIQVRRNR